MTPTQVKELEKKIDKLEKKLDFVIHHYIQEDIEEDWIDDPRLLPVLEKRFEESKKGKLYTGDEIFKKLGL